MVSQPNFLNVDWSKLPAPVDDGACSHLTGMQLPSISRPSTNGSEIRLDQLRGRLVLYAYPMTGQPGVPLPDGWDGIPGARGCTPQSCSFRDHFSELTDAGADHVVGLSTQDTAYQLEVAERLHLPFPLLSDWNLALTEVLGLPIFEVEGRTLLKRLALVIDDGRITQVFYPVFPPDQNAGDVLAWLKANPVRGTS
jgi:peroxiredoxin